MSHNEFLRMLNERPIAYYPIYRKITGSTTAGLLLSQLMYWFSKKDKFFKTDEDIRNETLLTEKELKTAKQKIKKIAFIKVTREGLPAKTYYSIDWDLYAEFMNEFYNKNVKNEQTIKDEKDLTRLDERDNPRLDERDKHNGTKGTNITYTKTTYTKTTNIEEKKNEKYLDDEELNELFIEYLKYRKSKKLSNSGVVIKRLINKLREFYKLGANPREVIENAIVNGWKDFYMPNSSRDFSTQAKKRQIGSESIEEIKKRTEERIAILKGLKK